MDFEDETQLESQGERVTDLTRQNKGNNVECRKRKVVRLKNISKGEEGGRRRRSIERGRTVVELLRVP